MNFSVIVQIFQVGDVVEFTAEITLKECPKDPNHWRQSFDIAPVGVSESLTVNVEMICDCPCEHPGNVVSILCTDIEIMEWKVNYNKIDKLQHLIVIC